MDISIGGNPAGRITIELFADTTPKTADIFRTLCTGDNSAKLHYKGNKFWLASSTVLKGGDYGSKHDRESVFGVDPKPENFVHKHDGFGVVSMVIPSGPQFAIAITELPSYDGGQVVVGKVVEGLYVVKAIENVWRAPVVITDCGELPESNILAPQQMSTEQVASTSNKQLSSRLKEIMNVKERSGSERCCPKVEIAEIFRRNLDILSDLKAQSWATRISDQMPSDCNIHQVMILADFTFTTLSSRPMPRLSPLD